MTIYFIESMKMLINSDHIIRANYVPELEVTDDYDKMTGQLKPPYKTKSRLTLKTTELERDCEFSYDGNVLGTAATSKEIVLRGVDADLLFGTLTLNSHAI